MNLLDVALTVFYAGIIALCILIPILVYKKIKGSNSKKDLFFKDFNVGKFKVVMFRKIGEKYHQIDKLKIKIDAQKFVYKNKDFKTFDMNKIAYSDNKNNYYAFDFDTGDQLTFKTKGMPEKISIDDVDIYVNRHIVADIVKGLEEFKPKSQWVLIVVGLILGLGIGLIIGMYVAPKPTITPQNTPVPNIALSIIEKLRGFA